MSCFTPILQMGKSRQREKECLRLHCQEVAELGLEAVSPYPSL